MFKRFFKAEGGFTLVELLVTLAILGVLFGIVTLTLSGVGTDAENTTALAECGVVQSAMDIYLAADTSNSFPARTTAAVIASSDISGAGADAPFGTYLRGLPTEFTYTWTASSAGGDVTCPDYTP